jgi:hypothetical protein
LLDSGTGELIDYITICKDYADFGIWMGSGAATNSLVKRNSGIKSNQKITYSVDNPKELFQYPLRKQKPVIQYIPSPARVLMRKYPWFVNGLRMLEGVLFAGQKSTR